MFKIQKNKEPADRKKQMKNKAFTRKYNIY